MNVLNAIGNVGQDATMRYTPKGDAVTDFSFALQSGYGDNQVTTWLRCSVWGKRGETLAPMLTKGTRIGITGELTNRKYVDKQGAEKYSLEVRVSDVTLLGTKDASTGSAQRQDSKPSDGLPNDFDDELPPF